MSYDYFEKCWKIFKRSFTVDTSEEPIYMTTRIHLGTFAALIMSIYNTFLIRQRIIKNAISLSKSNNPRVVKVMSVGIGSLYFVGLFCLWHIPSFFLEVAARLYCSVEDVTTNALLGQYLEKQIFSRKHLNKILEGEGLKI